MYWVDSYRELPQLVLNPELKEDLETLGLTLYSIPDYGLPINPQLLLPEDSRIVGFMPLHDYYLSHKDFLNQQASKSQFEIIRAMTVRELIDQILDKVKQTPIVNENEF